MSKSETQYRQNIVTELQARGVPMALTAWGVTACNINRALDALDLPPTVPGGEQMDDVIENLMAEEFLPFGGQVDVSDLIDHFFSWSRLASCKAYANWIVAVKAPARRLYSAYNKLVQAPIPIGGEIAHVERCEDFRTALKAKFGEEFEYMRCDLDV